MAFELSNFNNITSGQSASFEAKVWSYASSSDTLETISASGYFTQMKHALAQDNLIYISASDGRGLYYVTSLINADTVTIEELSESEVHSGFSDSNFNIYNNADNTKKLQFDVSAISTGTTRTISVIDSDLTLDDMAGQNSSSVDIDGGTIDNVSIGASQTATDITSRTLTLNTSTSSGSPVPLNIVNNINNLSTSAIFVDGTLSTSYANLYLRNDGDYDFDIGINPSGASGIENHAYLFTYGLSNIRFGTNNTLRATLTSTGTFEIDTVDIDAGAIDGVTIGATTPALSAAIDNISIDGNTISSTDTNGDVQIDPAGSGEIDLNANTVKVSRDIARSADTSTKIGFGTGLIENYISGSVLLDLTASGLQLSQVGARITQFDDDASLTANSSTRVPTQAAVKSYIDTNESGPTFSDSEFRVNDNTDATKQIAFEASGITTGTVRTITMPDQDLTLANMATQTNTSVNIDGGAIDGCTIGTNSAITDLRVDDLKLDGSILASTLVDGSIYIDPTGNGRFRVRPDGNNELDVTVAGVQLGGTGARCSSILDEDDMSSDSNTALATQQSIKAYVDSEASSTAKVYLAVNWSAGSPVDLDSYGVSSLTDTASGKVQLNFTTSFADANYAVASSGGNNSDTNLRVFEPYTRNTGDLLMVFKQIDTTPSISIFDTGVVQGVAIFHS